MVDDDDMSPTGGGIGFVDDDDDDLSESQNSPGDTGLFKEVKGVSARTRTKSLPKSMNNDERHSESQFGKPSGQETISEDTYNSASPISGAELDSSATPTAWEQIRQQNMSGSSESTGSQRWAEKQSQARRKQDGSDDFMFSSEEQEKSYARNEAQKQFDERVERERRGGDFADGGGSDEGRASGWQR